MRLSEIFRSPHVLYSVGMLMHSGNMFGNNRDCSSFTSCYNSSIVYKISLSACYCLWMAENVNNEALCKVSLQ